MLQWSGALGNKNGNLVNWEDKFKIVNSSLATHEEIEQDFYIKDSGASNTALSLIRKKYSYGVQLYVIKKK